MRVGWLGRGGGIDLFDVFVDVLWSGGEVVSSTLCAYAVSIHDNRRCNQHTTCRKDSSGRDINGDRYHT